MTKPALGGLLVSLLVSTATFGDVASLQDIGAAGVVFSDGTNIRYCASGVSNCSSASVLASAGGWGVPRLSPDGTKLAYGDVNSADVADFNRATGLSNITSLESGEGTNGAYSLAWSSDSQTIYTYEPEGVNGTRQHVIETYSRSGGARTGTLSVPAGSGSTIYRLILGDTHPDTGRLVAIAGTSTGASNPGDVNHEAWPAALAADGTIYFLNESNSFVAQSVSELVGAGSTNNVSVQVGGDHGVWTPEGDFIFSAGSAMGSGEALDPRMGTLYLYRPSTQNIYRLTGQKTYRSGLLRNDTTRWAFKDPTVTPDKSGITFVFRRGIKGGNNTSDYDAHLGYVTFGTISALIAAQPTGTYTCGDYACSNVSFLKQSDIIDLALLSRTTVGYDLVQSTSPPGTPTGVAAAAGNAQATVSWSAPGSDGGAAITGYTVTASPGGATCTTTGALSCVVTGLTNGTSYTFTVTATNSLGTGSASSASDAVTPLASALTPAFGAPTSTVDGFTVQVSNYDAAYTWAVSTDAGTAAVSDSGLVTVTGLAPEQSATVTVTTTRTGYAGGSAPATGSAITGAALTPTFGTATSTADGFTVQVSNYEAAYTWAVSATAGSATINGSGLVTVTGLAPGQSTTVTVTTSRGGYEGGSAEVTGSAMAIAPGAPTGVAAAAGNAQATVSWSAPGSDGGAAITGYTVTASPGGATCTTTGALSCVVTGLTNGTSYTFTVTATNNVGTGAASAASNAVTPYVTIGSDVQPLLNAIGEFPDAPLNECQYIEANGTVGGTDVSIDLVGESVSCGVATSIEIDLAGNEADATTVEDGQLIFFSGREGIASGIGFLPGSEAEVWIASTPRYLGTVTVASDGTWTQVFDVPSDIADGEHTIQAEGTGASGGDRAVNAGVMIRSAPPSASALPVPGLGGLATLILAGLLGIIGILGRRRVTSAH